MNKKHNCNDCGIEMMFPNGIVKATKDGVVYYEGKPICGVCSNKRYRGNYNEQ